MLIRKHTPQELAKVNRYGCLRSQRVSTFVLGANRPQDKKIDQELKAMFSNLNKGYSK
jgi:hypothetical protein